MEPKKKKKKKVRPTINPIPQTIDRSIVYLYVRSQLSHLNIFNPVDTMSIKVVNGTLVLFTELERNGIKEVESFIVINDKNK